MKVRPISVNEFRWLKSAIDTASEQGDFMAEGSELSALRNEITEMRAVLERMRAVNKEYRNLRLLFERGQI
jgi:hypothetical protein